MYSDGTYTNSQSALGDQSELMTVFTLCASVREVAVQEPAIDLGYKSVMLGMYILYLFRFIKAILHA